MKIICENCKTEFNVKTGDYKKGQRCCSRKCSNENKKLKSVIADHVCDTCGKEFKNYDDKNHVNKYCSRECYYKGRRLKHIDGTIANVIRGYNWIYINGYSVREHDYLIEKSINRKLTKAEVVHHINFLRNDNRIENLKLMTRADHTGLHASQRIKTRNSQGKFIKTEVII